MIFLGQTVVALGVHKLLLCLVASDFNDEYIVHQINLYGIISSWLWNCVVQYVLLFYEHYLFYPQDYWAPFWAMSWLVTITCLFLMAWLSEAVIAKDRKNAWGAPKVINKISFCRINSVGCQNLWNHMWLTLVKIFQFSRVHSQWMFDFNIFLDCDIIVSSYCFKQQEFFGCTLKDHLYPTTTTCSKCTTLAWTMTMPTNNTFFPQISWSRSFAH